MTYWDHDAPREVETVKGCFMLLRREALDAVGLMDEGFFLYGEETDLCCRMRRAGRRVMFAPEPQIVHLGDRIGGERAALLVHLVLRIPALAVLAALGARRNAFHRDLAFAYARGAPALALSGRRGRQALERWLRLPMNGRNTER